MEGAYDISCPDPHCPTQVSNTTLCIPSKILQLRKIQGVLNQTQMEILTDKHLMEKHRTFRLNTGKSSPGLKSLHFLFTVQSHFPQLT